jgi:creatinine amidohydrolase
MHAGELEVSILQAVTPDALRDGFGSADYRSDVRPHLLIEGMAAYTSSGVIGRPSAGTAAKGKAILASLVASFGEHLHQLSAA